MKLNLNAPPTNGENATQQPNYGQPQQPNYGQQQNYNAQQNYGQPTYQPQQNTQQSNYQPPNIPQQNVGYNPYQQQNIPSNQPNYTANQNYNPIPQQPLNNTPPVKPKKSKKKLIIIISIIVVLLVTGELTIKFTFFGKDNVGNKGFATPEQAVSTFFTALNTRNKELMASCFPDMDEDTKSAPPWDSIFESFNRISANIDLNSIKTDTWYGTKEDSYGNSVGDIHGTFEFTQVDPNNTTNIITIRESFTFTITKLKKNDKYILTWVNVDQNTVEVIDGYVEDKPTEEPTTEKQTEASQNPVIYGIADKEIQLVQQIFANANNRDAETMFWYFVPDEYSSNSDKIKENITAWINNIKNTDIQYDLTTIQAVGNRKELGKWGNYYNEYEQEYTVQATTTKNGTSYLCKQSITIQYIEADAKTYALTAFVLSDDYEIISSEPISSEEVTSKTTETTETTEKTTEITTGDLSNDLLSRQIMINGNVYTFDIPYSQVKDIMKIDLAKYGYADGYIMNAGDKVYGTMDVDKENYDSKIIFTIGFKNNDTKAKDILETDIWSLSCDISWTKTNNYPIIILPGGITWGSTAKDVEKAYGKPQEEIYRAEDLKYSVYEYHDEKQFYKVKLYVYDDKGVQKISIDNYR